MQNKIETNKYYKSLCSRDDSEWKRRKALIKFNIIWIREVVHLNYIQPTNHRHVCHHVHDMFLYRSKFLSVFLLIWEWQPFNGNSKGTCAAKRESYTRIDEESTGWWETTGVNDWHTVFTERSWVVIICVLFQPLNLINCDSHTDDSRQPNACYIDHRCYLSPVHPHLRQVNVEMSI